MGISIIQNVVDNNKISQTKYIFILSQLNINQQNSEWNNMNKEKGKTIEQSNKLASVSTF